MVPHLTLKYRIIAWLLFRLNGWSLDDEWEAEVIKHPGSSAMCSICRDYWYAKRWERDVR